MYLSRFFVFYPFFVLGQLCDREKLAAVSRRPGLRWGGLILLAGWGALCLLAREPVYTLRYLFTGRRAFSIHEMFLPWGCLWRLLCYAISLVMGFAFLCVMPDRRLPVVTVFGRRTMQIYFWHGVFQDLFTGLGNSLCATLPGRLGWIGVAVAVAFLSGLKIFSVPTEPILRAARTDPPAEKP